MSTTKPQICAKLSHAWMLPASGRGRGRSSQRGHSPPSLSHPHKLGEGKVQSLTALHAKYRSKQALQERKDYFHDHTRSFAHSDSAPAQTWAPGLRAACPPARLLPAHESTSAFASRCCRKQPRSHGAKPGGLQEPACWEQMACTSAQLISRPWRSRLE